MLVEVVKKRFEFHLDIGPAEVRLVLSEESGIYCVQSPQEVSMLFLECLGTTGVSGGDVKRRLEIAIRFLVNKMLQKASMKF